MTWRDAALAHAQEAYPRECCGLVVRMQGGGRPEYRPCTNIAAAGDEFQISPDDLFAAEDDAHEVLAVVHSHPDQPEPIPSRADLQACDDGDMPWHIVAVPSGAWVTVQPALHLPDLIGREFEYGVADCYSIVRDWYRMERGVWLGDVERTTDTDETGAGLYLPRLQAHGWRVVDGLPRVGDVLLMRMGARTPNHAAVYIGADTIVHHLEGRLSAREPWGGDYRDRTSHILRHASDPTP